MKKARLATMWLDGCSGCHMSLLDIDEAIVAVAQQADIVYGPLVDAQEIPPDIDVAIVEGAVSSEDDLEKLRKMRLNARILIALGDCAVTGNVPAMRNPLPVKVILERVYVEGADVSQGRPRRGRAASAQAGGAVARRGEGGSARAGLPAVGADAILYVVKELLGGPRPRSRIPRSVRLRRPPHEDHRH